MKSKSKKLPLKQCPRCGQRTFVESIFGSICGACFFEPKGGFSKIDKVKIKQNDNKI